MPLYEISVASYTGNMYTGRLRLFWPLYKTKWTKYSLENFYVKNYVSLNGPIVCYTRHPVFRITATLAVMGNLNKRIGHYGKNLFVYFIEQTSVRGWIVDSFIE